MPDLKPCSCGGIPEIAETWDTLRIFCPDCGRLVTAQDIGAECSSGRVWYDFLESVGYYVPYEKRAEENDWYGEDMVLTEEQAKQLADFVSENQPYNARDVECLVARALMRGNKVVINADW